jgi:hypothetical protein
MTSVQNNENDHNYLDITIKGNPRTSIGNTFVRAEYREQRTEAILAIPNQWELGIVRFSVPSDNIPLFSFPNNTFFVRLIDVTTGGIFIQPVIYTFSIVNPYGLAFQPIYTYSTFITLINVALAAAFLALKTANPAFPGIHPPVLQYDSATKIISLYAEIAAWSDALNLGTISFNNALIRYFYGLESISTPDPEYQMLLVYSRVGNTVTYLGQPNYVMASDFIDVLNWDEVAQVLITTTSVPIIPEQKAIANNQNAVFQSLLTDFNFAGQGFREAGRLTFYNQANIRFYDMISDHPMTQFDLVFLFSDLAGNTFPIFISEADSANIKVIFKRKLTIET